MKLFICLLALTIAGAANAGFLKGGYTGGYGGYSGGYGAVGGYGGGYGAVGGYNGGYGSGETKIVKVIHNNVGYSGGDYHQHGGYYAAPAPVVHHHVEPVQVVKVINGGSYGHGSYGHGSYGHGSYGHDSYGYGGYGNGYDHGYDGHSASVVKVVKVHHDVPSYGGWYKK